MELPETDLEHYALLVVARHLSKPLSWHTLLDEVSGHGLDRSEISLIQQRAREIMTEEADRMKHA